MKKKKAAASVCIVLVLCAAFWFFCKPVYYRLYPFDRIRGDIQVVADGQTHALREESFADCRKVKQQDDGSASIRIRAGEYGYYTFELYADAIEQPVTVRCIQHNWWNVMDFDLHINIDTQKNTILFSGSVITIDDHGRKMRDALYDEQEITDHIDISFGL